MNRLVSRTRSWFAALAVLATITCRDVPTAPVARMQEGGGFANALGLTVSPARDTVLIGQNFTLTALGSNGAPVTKPTTWTSSDTSVATVTSTGTATARVTAKDAGTTTITASSQGKTGTNSTTVIPVPVRSVSVVPDTASRERGDSVRYTATPKDSAGNTLTGRVIVWSSADTNVATVTSAGWARGRARGSVGIRATVEGVVGSGAFTVRVPQLTVPSISGVDSVNAGDSVLVVYSVANVWDDPNADSVIVRVGIRNGAGTVVTAARRALSRVRAGMTRADSVRLAFSATAAAGNYSIVAYADCADVSGVGDIARLTDCLATPATAGAIAEGVETDNSNSAVLVTRRPELTITGVAAADTFFTRTSATTTVLLNNSGSSTLAGFDVVAGIYDVTASAVVAAGVTSTAALSSRGTRDVPVAITMPAAVDASHSYELRAYADCAGTGTASARLAVCFATPDTGVVVEGNDGNNSTTRAVAVASNVLRVVIQPDSLAFIAFGDSASLTARAYDRSSALVAGVAFTWTPLDPAVATVVAGSGNAMAHALANGTARVMVSAEGRADTIPVYVVQRVAIVATTPASVTVNAIGQTTQLSAAATDRNGYTVSGAVITWNSLDGGVATVNGTGLVTAASVGAARVVATSSGVADTSIVNVTQVAARVSVAPRTATLDAVGDTIHVAASVFDANDNAIPSAPVTWTSLDAAVASVTATGRVSALTAGSAAIVASSGGHADTAHVSIVPQVASVTASPATAALGALGETTQLSAAAADRNGNAIATATFTWSSLDASVATVNASGLVTAVAVGSARIVASSSAHADTSLVTVTQIAAHVAVTPDSITLGAIGASAVLTGTVYDNTSHPIPGATLDWASLDASIATVAPDGRVTAVSNGATSVVASSNGHADTARVVVAQQVARVMILEDSIVVHAIQDTARFNAWLFDANGNQVAGAVTWSSLDPDVAVPATGGAFVSGVGTVNGAMATVGRVVATTAGHADTARLIIDQIGARVRLDPDSVVVPQLGRTYRFSVTAYDSSGYAMYNPRISWTSLKPNVASIDASTGVATTISVGRAPIVAVVGSGADTAILISDRAVASVVVTPDTALLARGGTLALTGNALDQAGNPIAEKPVAWWSTNATVARVDSQGVVTALEEGVTKIVATRDAFSDTTIIYVNPVGYTTRWIGAGDASWNSASNWYPHQVPDASTSTYIPTSTTQPDLFGGSASVGNLRVDVGAQIRGGDAAVLNAFGNVEWDGSSAIGQLNFAGAGSLRGNLPRTTVATNSGSSNATATLVGRTTSPLVSIGGGMQGSLVVNGQTLVTTTLIVGQAGSVAETNAMDSVIVTEDAQFAGTPGMSGSTLTAGVLAIGRDFAAYNASSAFAPSGSHTVIFTGTGAHRITGDDSTGLFQNVYVGGTATFMQTSGIRGRMRLLPGSRVLGQDQYNTSLNFASLLPETELGSYEIGVTKLRGSVTLARDYAIPTILMVELGGALALGGHTLDVMSLNVYDGSLTMSSASDSLVVRQWSQFYGRENLSAGTYVTQGDMSVMTTPQVPGSAWNVSGTHKIVFNGSQPQNISIGDSLTMGLQNVEIRNTQGVTLGNTNIYG
ncbi:MAG TPA: Ig-like domain-containing protein, partial [Gemmatimonadaceae bacterium]|nr:Ig-like domain-containing protein [Gemmatimonadaceae bacterium]